MGSGIEQSTRPTTTYNTCCQQTIVVDNLGRERRQQERARVYGGRGGACEGVWSCVGVCGAGEVDGNAGFEGDGGGPL